MRWLGSRSSQSTEFKVAATAKRGVARRVLTLAAAIVLAVLASLTLASPASAVTVGGITLNDTESANYAYIQSNILPDLPGSADQNANNAALVTWWALRDGVLDTPNAFRYTSCGANVRGDPLSQTCPGQAWQLGISGVQYNASDAFAGSKAETAWLNAAKTVYPNKSESEILTAAAAAAGYPPNQTESNTIVNSTGALRASWFARTPAVGFYVQSSIVQSRCFASAGPECFATANGQAVAGQQFDTAVKFANSQTSSKAFVSAVAANFGSSTPAAAGTGLFNGGSSGGTGSGSGQANGNPGPFDWINWICAKLITGMTGLLTNVLNFILSVEEPTLGAAFFSGPKGQYPISIGIAGVLTVPFVLLATIQGILKGGLRGVLHAYLIGLPIALLGAAGAIAVVSLCQSIDQNLTDSVLGLAQANFNEYVNRINAGDPFASLGVSVVYMFLCFLMIPGLLFLWLEMIVRGALIYMAVLFIPISLAAYIWPASRRWAINLIELTLTAVFAKFVVIATLGLGFGAVTASIGKSANGQQFADVGLLIAGVLTVFLSAVAMPGLILFIMGPSVRLVGREDAQTVMPLTMERQAARDTAVSAYNQIGRLFGK